jgi:pyruvate,orthophosphate dikinase
MSGGSIKGLGASPGAASGVLMLRTEDALDAAARGQKVVLLRAEMGAEDVPAIKVSAGVVCTRGGLTGDAAIIARTLGKPCVVGFPHFVVDYSARSVRVPLPGGDAEHTLLQGDPVSIDGAKGLFAFGETAD